MVSPSLSDLAQRRRVRAGRPTRLAQAVGLALALGALPVGAMDPATPSAAEAAPWAPEAASRAQLATVQQGLPDLGGAASVAPLLDEAVLLERALSAVAAGQAAGSSVGARAFDSGQAAQELVESAVNAGAREGLQALRATGLPFLGTLQGGISYGSEHGEIDFDLVGVGALWSGGGHHLLGQLGAHNEVDRPTLNAGLVYRWLNPARTAFYGGNVFYDRDFETGAERWGVGVEAVTARTRVFANTYAPLSDRWFDSPHDPLREERPARGVDLGASYRPARAPGLELQVKGTRWDGESVDVFGGGGEGLKDPTVLSARVEYKPMPLVGFSVEHEKALDGQSDTRAMVNFSYQFGVPVQEQRRRTAGGAAEDVSARLLAPVERENRIVMETREKVPPVALTGPAVVRASVREDELYSYLLGVTGGMAPFRLTLGGADAAVFALEGYQLTLDGPQLPSAQDGTLAPSASGDHVFEVTVSVRDARGGRAEQRFEIEVLQVDTDEDGLSDRQEAVLGTDPSNPDTDGDGLQDGHEVETGTDPLDPNDPLRQGVPVAVTVTLGGTVLNGHPQVGERLQAQVTCRGQGGCRSDLTYRWQIETAWNSGVYQDIAGATADTHVVARDQQRRRVRVQVAAPAPAVAAAP